MRTLVIRIGNISGPPLGGFAMGTGGVPAALALAGALFAVSLPLLLTVRIGPLAAPEGTVEGAARATAWSELADGLRYLCRHRLLGPLVLSGALSEFALNGPLNVGLVLLAGERGWGASGMAWIVSGFGVGAGASALLITVLGRLPRAGALQPVALLAASVGIAAVGLVPTLSGAVATACASGLIGSISGGLSSALIQTTTDPAYLGRVTSVTSLSAFGLSPPELSALRHRGRGLGHGPCLRGLRRARHARSRRHSRCTRGPPGRAAAYARRASGRASRDGEGGPRGRIGGRPGGVFTRGRRRGGGELPLAAAAFYEVWAKLQASADTGG